MNVRERGGTEMERREENEGERKGREGKRRRRKGEVTGRNRREEEERWEGKERMNRKVTWERIGTEGEEGKRGGG